MSRRRVEHVVEERSEKKMRKLTEQALEKGDITDFSFLVGADGEAELLHCPRFNLLLASDYFRGLLNSPFTGPPPVRIEHVQPYIFKIILRFITTCHLPKLSNFHDAVALATAVDYFLLDVLQPFCTSEFERLITVETVWATLKEYHDNPLVHPACIKLLSYQPKDCIDNWTFFTHGCQESFIFFLKLDAMDISSEIELFRAFLKVYKNWYRDDGKEVLQTVMPYLRLLTLKPDEVTSELLDFLSETEKDYILSRLDPSKDVTNLEIPATLNPNTSHREPSSRIYEMKPGKYILSILPCTTCAKADSEKNNLDCDSSTLSMDTHQAFRLTAVWLVSGFASNEFVVEVSYPGGYSFTGSSCTMKREKSDSKRIEFRPPLDIPKGVRLEIIATSKKPVKYEEISQPTTTSCKQEGVLSKFYFKNSVDDRFNRSIIKCFMIKGVSFEIV